MYYWILFAFGFREEREKLNVWVALMNLENIYGTPESLVEVFEEALKQNDTQTVFFKLTSIYTRAKKFDVSDDHDASVICLFWSLLSFVVGRAAVPDNDKAFWCQCQGVDTLWAVPYEAGKAAGCQKPTAEVSEEHTQQAAS